MKIKINDIDYFISWKHTSNNRALFLPSNDIPAKSTRMAPKLSFIYNLDELTFGETLCTIYHYEEVLDAKTFKPEKIKLVDSFGKAYCSNKALIKAKKQIQEYINPGLKFRSILSKLKIDQYSRSVGRWVSLDKCLLNSKFSIEDRIKIVEYFKFNIKSQGEARIWKSLA